VFSNCDSVRLSAYDGAKIWTKPVLHEKGHMPNQPVVFENVWDFWEARSHSYSERNWQKVNLVAEGVMGGKVVCSEKKMPSRRSTKIRLRADELGKKLVADGSDFIIVVAEITDDNGNVRRLAKDNVAFTVEGEGEIIGDQRIGANPRTVEFGSAPVLIRSTLHAGKIKVKAHALFEGPFAPASSEIEFESIPSKLPFCFIEQGEFNVSGDSSKESNRVKLSEEDKNKLLKEVDQQQMEFGVSPKK
jgi:beta-galactosidase